MKLNLLPATVEGDVHAIVEAARGARTKYKFDPGTSMFTLHKILPRGMTYPANFGFIPSTRAEDGDPLDVLVLSEEPTPPGCLVRCRTLGVIEAVQFEGGKRIRNDRIVAVPIQEREIRTIRDVSPTQLREIEEFFVAFNRILGKRFEILGHKGRAQADRIIRKTRILGL
jgi:inorganic pyrophosphatase